MSVSHSVVSAHDSFSLIESLSINPVIAAVTILVVMYAVLLFEVVNRAVLALFAAGLMIVLGVINQEQAFSGIDMNTIALLIGMMMIVNITSKCGLFQYIAIKAAKVVNANPLGILIMLCVITAIFSALLDNVTTVLLIAPITLLITDALKTKVYPFFFAEILSSNIGGTATLIGDPPNIIIGSSANLSFNDFLMNLAPIAAVNFLILVVIIWFVGKKVLANPDQDAIMKVMRFNENESITDKPLLYKSLFVLALVIFGFTVGHSYGIQPGTSAVLGASILMLLAYVRMPAEAQGENVHHIFAEVEWITIFFFVGLFIVVAGVESTGVLERLGSYMMAHTEGDMEKTAVIILWVSAVLSSFLDNIPFVATMIPIIESTAQEFGGAEAIRPLWWSLALGACLGGNGTLIGASANLTIAAFAEKAKQPIPFGKFILHAYGIMLLTVLVSHVYIVMRYF